VRDKEKNKKNITNLTAGVLISIEFKTKTINIS